MIVYTGPPLEPQRSVPMTEPNLGDLLVVGLGLWALAEGVKWLCGPPARDTAKYHYKVGNRIVHGGITDRDLRTREREHRRLWPDGYIRQVGRRTTPAAARTWERASGFA